MMQFLVYEAKAAVILAVFYMFYRLLLSKETFHRFNRVVLLVTATGSLLLPLWQLTFHEVVEVNPLPALPMVVETALPMVSEAEASAPWWPYALVSLFVIGALAVLGQTLYSLSRVLKIIASGEKKNLPGNAVLVVTEEPVTPFSWMRYVVMSRIDYAEADHATILCHEQAHIRLRHSWDLLLVDVVSALQWFNPAIWMLRSDLRAVHEYEADAQVLYEGFNVKQYQYLLVKKAVGTSGYSIANSFNHRELKSRITMMYRKKSSRSRVLRVLYFVPLVGACLFANARTEVSYVEKQAPPSDKVTESAGDLQELEQDSVLLVVDGEVKPYEQIKEFSSDNIKAMWVLKDAEHKEAYGEEAKDKDAVIVIETMAVDKEDDTLGKPTKKQPVIQEYWLDADGNDVFTADGQLLAWKTVKVRVIENRRTGERKETKIVGFEIDGKSVSEVEAQAYEDLDICAYHVSEDGIMTVMSNEYLEQKVAKLSASEE